jgi:cysteine sulfinate desulfinase/cysteine desulfurase-like protein
MSKSERPVLYLGLLPKRNVVLEALLESEKLLDSVAYVNNEGDTVKPLRLIRRAIKQVNSGK